MQWWAWVLVVVGVLLLAVVVHDQVFDYEPGWGVPSSADLQAIDQVVVRP